MSDDPTPAPAPTPTCYAEGQRYDKLVAQYSALTQQRQEQQAALNRADLEVQAALAYAARQESALENEAIQPLEAIYDDLDEAAQREIDGVRDQLRDLPPLTPNDLTAWEELTDAGINLVDYVGDLVPIALRSAALGWGLADLGYDWENYAEARSQQEELDAQIAAVGEELDEAEEALDACREANDTEQCAVCHRAFLPEELRECQGCGALFCEAHHNDAIERHEMLHGVSYTP